MSSERRQTDWSTHDSGSRGLEQWSPEKRRALLAQLDGCLEALEEAHERDEVEVGAQLSSMLRPHVPAIVSGMPIVDAMDLVFREQERYLAATIAGASDAELDSASRAEREAGLAVAPLDQSAARALTERIKRAAHAISLLLLQAHEQRAWLVLGYRSWGQYVRAEFQLSRPRSYELLDHGRLIRAIREATGTSTTIDIPPYTARRLKPHMGDFMAALRSRSAAVPGEDVSAIVTEVLRACLPANDIGTAPDSPPRGLEERLTTERSRGSVDAATLRAVIEYLASMPPASIVVDRVLQGRALSDLDGALAWLTQFSSACRARGASSRLWMSSALAGASTRQPSAIPVSAIADIG